MSIKSLKNALLGAVLASGAVSAQDTSAQDDAFLLAAAQNTGKAQSTVVLDGVECDKNRTGTEFKATVTKPISYQMFDAWQQDYLNKGVNPPHMVGVILDLSTDQKQIEAVDYIKKVLAETQKVADQCKVHIRVAPINYDEKLAESLKDMNFLKSRYPKFGISPGLYTPNSILVSVDLDNRFYIGRDGGAKRKVYPIIIDDPNRADSDLYLGVALRGHISDRMQRANGFKKVADEKNGAGSAGDAAGAGSSSANEYLGLTLGAG